MRCAVCKYKDNCKPRADEPLLSGCTSGHPMEFINPPEKWVLCPKCKMETVMDIKDMDSKAVEK